ncbi:MAG: 50S ribosomal protein L24 [Lentisphaerae bacterium]|jgi:large subunit ribosomal protein L24|nr:50S ribosomal protein L24 [Lentisphaerota bacterium]
MTKAKIKRNDVVFVITGADKGKSGKVLSVDSKSSRVIVEGVAVRKRTLRRSQEHPNGGIEERECPIHISNVMAEERYRARRSEK